MENRPVEAVQTQRINLVEVKGGLGSLRRHRRLMMNVCPVTDPSQQAVRDTGRTARPRRNRVCRTFSKLNSDDPSRSRHDSFEIGYLVVVKLGSKTEAVTQRPRKQPGSRRRPHQRERWYLNRNRGSSRPFTHNNVDPEILHSQVKHFFGRLGHPVDLVKKEHFAGY
jgi:hypothetical protein